MRIPTQPKTVGDHIRKRRLGLKLLQREVAEQVGVDATSVFNWEANACQPELRYVPAIIAFLGYNPLRGAKTPGEQLVQRRIGLGLSQKEAARQIGVDPSTLRGWERGAKDPEQVTLIRVQRFLSEKRPLESKGRAC